MRQTHQVGVRKKQLQVSCLLPFPQQSWTASCKLGSLGSAKPYSWNTADRVDLCVPSMLPSSFEQLAHGEEKLAAGKEPGFCKPRNKVAFGNKPTTVRRTERTSMRAHWGGESLGLTLPLVSRSCFWILWKNIFQKGIKVLKNTFSPDIFSRFNICHPFPPSFSFKSRD